VKLDDTGADGFIPARSIGSEYFQYVEAEHAMVGRNSGETFRLGDPVTVRLVEAIPVAGALRFELMSQGSQGQKPPRGRTSKPPRRERKDGHKGSRKPRYDDRMLPHKRRG